MNGIGQALLPSTLLAVEGSSYWMCCLCLWVCNEHVEYPNVPVPGVSWILNECQKYHFLLILSTVDWKDTHDEHST